MTNANFVIIKISNSCGRKPKYINDILVSSKNTPGIHGVGTRSIKKVVAKYNGNLEMKYDNNTKTFTSVIGINSNFIKLAVSEVNKYVLNHLDKSDDTPDFDTFVVWSCKTLQNHKCLISTTLHDGMYYECTYNGDKNEMYLDAYKKFENKKIICESEE